VFALKLTHDEPKLVYLALAYHLGRPGSELDHATYAAVEHGLSEVKQQLSAQLDEQSAVVELNQWQYERLLSAIKGSVTELRVYHMRNGASSTIPGWTDTTEALFPGTRQDPDFALDLAEAMIMLQRRLERARNAGRTA
jgi:hypothetical protein